MFTNNHNISNFPYMQNNLHEIPHIVVRIQYLSMYSATTCDCILKTTYRPVRDKSGKCYSAGDVPDWHRRLTIGARARGGICPPKIVQSYLRIKKIVYMMGLYGIMNSFVPTPNKKCFSTFPYCEIFY